jgi:hypothetical protein
MSTEHIVKKFNILKTSMGYMVEQVDGDAVYIDKENGDNCFDTYQEAVIVFIDYLKEEIA